MLTVSTIAKALGVSDKHVYRLIESGQLQAINVSAVAGRQRLRVSSESLQAFKSARITCPSEKINVDAGKSSFASGGKEFIASALKTRQRHRHSSSKAKSAKIYSLVEAVPKTA